MRYFEVVKQEHKKFKDITPILPKRSTSKSAGYDLYLQEDIICKPGQTCLTWTDIKVCLNDDEVFKIYIRSSVGIKNKIAIANGTGIIDSDFFNNESNDGNIIIALYNYGNEAVKFKKGYKIAQGVFQKYLITVDDDVTNERKGGIGSTDKK